MRVNSGKGSRNSISSAQPQLGHRLKKHCGRRNIVAEMAVECVVLQRSLETFSLTKLQESRLELKRSNLARSMCS